MGPSLLQWHLQPSANRRLVAHVERLLGQMGLLQRQVQRMVPQHVELQLLQRPVADPERYARVWEEHVRPLDGAYVMVP